MSTDVPAPEPEPLGARAGEHVPPSLGASAYTCPFCGVLANVQWEQAYVQGATEGYRGLPSIGFIAPVLPLVEGMCVNCGNATVWVGELEPERMEGSHLLWPTDAGGAPMAHPDMPDEVRADYDEARAIVSRSPRGATALLRLAVERLAQMLTGKTPKLDVLIGQLVADGLPVAVQQALDALRVIGNNAVHPGQIDTDDPATAGALFGLLNLVVEQRIAQPRAVREVYDTLPAGALDAIARRDAQTTE